VAGQVSYVIEKGEQVHSIEQAKALVAVQPTSVAPIVDEEDDEAAEEFDEIEAAGNVEEVGEAGEPGEDDHEAGGERTAEAAQGDGERNGRKRRRRRRGRRGGEGREGEAPAAENGAAPIMAGSESDREPPAGTDAEAETEFSGPEVQGESQADGEKRRRRRGRRGGRRSRHGRDGEALPQASDSAAPLQAESDMAEPPQGEERAPDQSLPWQAEPVQSQADHGSAYRQDHAEPSFERHQPAAAQEREPDREAERPAPQPENGPLAPVPAAGGPAAPRRGSTVREPAPNSFGSTSFSREFSAAPPPAANPEPEQPPTTGSESEDTGRPRRAGWWSKRVLGKG
jgi:ribonuclease E